MYVQGVINTTVFQADQDLLTFFSMNIPPQERASLNTFVGGIQMTM